MLNHVLITDQRVYCKTQEEVDWFMDVAEAKGLRWTDGEEPRFYNDGYPIVYTIRMFDHVDRITFSNPPLQHEIDEAIPASELRNYVISIRARRN